MAITRPGTTRLAIITQAITRLTDIGLALAIQMAILWTITGQMITGLAITRMAIT